MGWVQLVLLVMATVTMAGCELAGDILEAGAWMGAIGVILVIAIIGFVVAKIRG
jgi:hypothetical protein